MFSDLYCRVPVRQLASESAWLLKHGVNPELAISNDFPLSAKPADIAAITVLLRQFPACTMHAPFIDMFPGASDADVRAVCLAKLQKTMEWADIWQAKLVVMHFNYDPIYYRQSIEHWLTQIAQSFQSLLQSAPTPLIALENIAEPTPDISCRVAAAIGHERIVHCFDFGHQHVFSATDFRDWLAAISPKRHIHFHFHDNDGGEDDHLPLGAGTIDWPAVKIALENLNVPFTVTLEPHTADNRAKTYAAYQRLFLA